MSSRLLTQHLTHHHTRVYPRVFVSRVLFGRSDRKPRKRCLFWNARGRTSAVFDCRYVHMIWCRSREAHVTTGDLVLCAVFVVRVWYSFRWTVVWRLLLEKEIRYIMHASRTAHHMNMVRPVFLFWAGQFAI